MWCSFCVVCCLNTKVGCGTGVRGVRILGRVFLPPNLHPAFASTAFPHALCSSPSPHTYTTPHTGTERVLWVTNQDDTTGSARTMGGSQKLTLTISATQVLTWLVDLAAVPSKRTGACVCIESVMHVFCLSLLCVVSFVSVSREAWVLLDSRLKGNNHQSLLADAGWGVGFLLC